MSSPGFALAVLLYACVNLLHVAVHLLVARRLGVTVNRVSLGVGPTLLARTRGGTTYRLALLPLGLLVRLRAPWKQGESGVWPPVGPSDLRARGLGDRLLLFASPPLAILLLCLVAAYWANSFDEERASDLTVIGDLLPGGPADRAGVRRGDRVERLGAQPVESWTELKRAVEKLDTGPTSMTVRRGEALLELQVTPELRPGAPTPALGIMSELERTSAPGPLARVGAAFGTVGRCFGLYARSLVATGKDAEAISIGGPGAIVREGAGTASGDEWALGMAVLVTYSLFKYLLLCLWLPYLDGRRLLFLAIEALRRAPLHPKYEQRFNPIWLCVVAVLAVISLTRELMSV